MNFETFLTEGVEFEKNPTPHHVVPTQNRFGQASYHVKNQHDWRNQTIGTHSTQSDAQAHADALNKAHREKHGIKD
jgi:hypothetical protein